MPARTLTLTLALAAASALAVLGGTPASRAASTPDGHLSPALTATSLAALPGFVVGGHRNGQWEFPEGSRRGSDAALAHGVTVLDYDVNRLADGTPVIFHDASLGRLTTSTGSVHRLTRARWSRLRLDPAHYFGPGYPDEPPMTLAQLLDRYRGRAVLVLEVKDPSITDRVVAEVKVRHMVGEVVLQSHRLDEVTRLHRLGVHAQLWQNPADVARARPWTWRVAGAESVEVASWCTDEQIRKAERAGLPVWAWGANTPSRLERLRELGVRAVLADRPLYASGALTPPATP